MATRSSSFDAQVYEVVMRVPRGRLTTYGDVAAVLGNRHLARQVGWALARLSEEQARVVPWQRVINAQGRVSHRGDVLRADRQYELLVEEGVAFTPSGRCDLADLRCTASELAPHLEALE